LLPVSDGAALSRHVDGVLLVAQSNNVSLGQIQDSVAILQRAGAPLLGIVLTRAKLGKEVAGEYEYAQPKEKKGRKR